VSAATASSCPIWRSTDQAGIGVVLMGASSEALFVLRPTSEAIRDFSCVAYDRDQGLKTPGSGRGIIEAMTRSEEVAK